MYSHKITSLVQSAPSYSTASLINIDLKSNQMTPSRAIWITLLVATEGWLDDTTILKTNTGLKISTPALKYDIPFI